MASSGKKRTTMAKLNRENAVRERRLRKHVRKAARKLEAADRVAGPAESGMSPDAAAGPARRET
jgi:hypothetical protein